MLRIPDVGAGKPLPPAEYHNELAVDVAESPMKRHASVSQLELATAHRSQSSRDEPAPVESNGGDGKRPHAQSRVAKAVANFADNPLARLLEARRARADALFKAAIRADQNAKLSIFCTRPAIYSPVIGRRRGLLLWSRGRAVGGRR